MSGQLWYRHNPRDFLDGVIGMPPDLIGAYIVALDLIYARGGPIPNDARWLSGMMGCSTRQAAALVERLVERGKLHVIDGHISNFRAQNELETSAKTMRNAVEAGANGGRTRAENEAKANNINDKDQGTLKHGGKLDKNREEKKEREEESTDVLSARADAESIVSEWNAMARATGLPIVSALSDARRKAIRTRLAEHERPRFTEAIAKIGASTFCRESKWCGFDWLLKSANFIKVLEGNYDGNAARPVAPGAGAQPIYRANAALDWLRRNGEGAFADTGPPGGDSGARLALPQSAGHRPG